jgi:hypothetical protein
VHDGRFKRPGAARPNALAGLQREAPVSRYQLWLKARWEHHQTSSAQTPEHR